MNSLVLFVQSHQQLMDILVWPAVSLVLNALTDVMKLEESKVPALQVVDSLLSAFGLDAGKVLAILKSSVGTK